MTAPAVLAAWDRWDYLTVPLERLLAVAEADIVDIAPPSPDFTGGLDVHPAGRTRIEMPIGQCEIERDLTIRALLARWHGADTTDGPMPVEFRQEVRR